MGWHTSSINVTLDAWLLINMENWSAVQQNIGSQNIIQSMCWYIFWTIYLNHSSNAWKNQVWLHQSVTSGTKLFLSKVTWIIFIQKNIPPWKYGYNNISPCETRKFTACRSMHNILCLSGSGGSWKYCCKYVGNIDKNKYCTVSTSDDGSLIWRANCCTIPNVLLLINSNKKNYRRNETGDIRKGQLSVSIKSGTTFWSIQKLSLIWILL